MVGLVFLASGRECAIVEVTLMPNSDGDGGNSGDGDGGGRGGGGE